MKKYLAVFIVVVFFTSNKSEAQKKLDVGFWTQAWYQYVEDGKGDIALKDFMVRRAYLSLKYQPTDFLSFFTHIAVDRLGQDGLDIPSQGLGSGVAFRDLWITIKLSESIKIQAGRMYVPLTRNYGTTSTKSLLTTDLSFMQGGIRGGIFYTSKVGRDDGVTVWGNPLDGRLQYRVMVSEGMEDLNNPDDKLRVVGRLIFNLLEPEKEWFNQGTYFGNKKILSFGAGIDNQNNLTLNDIAGQDNLIWTIDGFFDYPVAKKDAVTIETAYIHLKNSTQANSYAYLVPGDNANLIYLQAGYYFGYPIGWGNFQPYLRFENVSFEDKTETRFITGGFNYYVKGHNAKASFDYTVIKHPETGPQSILTIQLAAGI